MALVTVLLMGTVFFGLATFAAMMAKSSHDNSARELDNIRARLAAEEAMAMATEELQQNSDVYGGGIGVLIITRGTTTYRTTCTSLGGGLYRIDAAGITRTARAGVSSVVQFTTTGSISYTPKAAVATRGPVSTTGNIEIDGRNWNYTATAVVGSGNYGVSSTGAISTSGNSKIGGNGIAPARTPPTTVEQAHATWRDNIDNDGDGTTDEEPLDGADNDDDGKIDEDTYGFPSNPDVLLGLSEGSLKAAAIAQGTYFTSANAVDAALSANGGVVPGGKILYLDFKNWQAVNFSSTYNDPPSIIVHHTTAGDANMKNIHGSFRGLLIGDQFENLNGDFTLLGGLVSFGQSNQTVNLGNGNAKLRLSTTVLSSLPSAATSGTVKVLARGRTGVTTN